MVAAHKKHKKHTLWRSPRIIVGSVILVLLVGASGWYFGVYRQSDSNKNQNTPIYPGPTKDEQTAGDNQKEQLAEDDKSPSRPDANSEGKQTANVTITDASQYDSVIEVRGYMPNVFEDGNCIITFSKGESKFQRTTRAFTDSSYTICTRATVSRSEFPSAGDWTVTIEYSSERYYGTANQTLEVK